MACHHFHRHGSMRRQAKMQKGKSMLFKDRWRVVKEEGERKRLRGMDDEGGRERDTEIFYIERREEEMSQK